MKPSFMNFLHKAQIFLVLALGTLPLAVFPVALLAEPLLVYAWIPPALYLLLALFSLKIPAKMRIVYGIVGMLLLLIAGLLVSSIKAGTWAITVAIAAFYGILLITGLQRCLGCLQNPQTRRYSE